MNLRDYAAQTPQEEPQAQAAQQAQESYFSLEELRAAINGGLRAGMTQRALLQAVIGKICGQDSAEAAAAAALPLSEAPQGSGLDIAIADAESRIAANKRRIKRLEAETAAAREQGEELRETLAQLQRSGSSNAAITETLSFYWQMQQGTAAAGAAEALLKRHRGQRAAMGLLYGILREKAAEGGFLDDLRQYAEIAQLAEQAKAAADA